MLDEASIALLERLFAASTASYKGVTALRFRADHCSHLSSLDKLQSDRLIQVRNGRYYVDLNALEHIADRTPRVSSLLYLCEHVFQALRNHYRQEPGEPIDFDTLVSRAEQPKRKVATGMAYMTEATILEKWATDSEGMFTSITPAESILHYDTFELVLGARKRELEESLARSAEKVSVHRNLAVHLENGQHFVHPGRIEELRSLQSDKVDLSRVVQLCEELNSSLAVGNFYSIALLARALLDHVPPVFGCGSFKEVANNFAHQSAKKSLLNLENSVRPISDGLLHQQIRKSEWLPNPVTVDFSRDLDVLLAEVVCILGGSPTDKT